MLTASTNAAALCHNSLLHLTNNLARPTQALNHLVALLAAADGIVTFLEQLLELVGAVHVLEELSLHFVFRVSVTSLLELTSYDRV